MKIDRLLAILTILLNEKQTTAPALAERLEVNRRTIGRDIEDLCMAGFPIITRQGAGGGISIAEGYKLDKSILSRHELQDILIGLKGLGSVMSPANMGSLVAKLSPPDTRLMSADSIVIDLSSFYRESLSQKIGILRDAIRQAKTVEFDYYSAKGVSERCIEPYCILYKWASSYIFGYCFARRDFRLFKLNRLWRLAMQETSFTPREIPAEKLTFDGGLSDQEKLVVLFDESAEYIVVEEYGPESFSRLPDGKLRLEVGFTNPGHMLRWILGFGDKAVVLEPAELREQIKAIAKNMLDSC